MTLTYNLERKTVLNTESEYKSLYSWSLQEVDADGKSVGTPQIPWEWSANFVATELAPQRGWRIEQGYDSKKKTTLPPSLSASRLISAKLKSGSIVHGAFEEGPTFSMLGTSRSIEEISLFVQPDDDAEDSARISAWGSPSYEGGFDFHSETKPDALVFYFSLPTVEFDALFESICRDEVSALLLYVSKVAGLYSDWSPDIITDQIKVLTDPRDHGLELPADSTIEPPKLSYTKIEKGSLTALSVRKSRYVAEAIQIAEDRESAWMHEDEAEEAEEAAPRLDANTLALAGISQKISTLQTIGWIAVAILALHLILR